MKAGVTDTPLSVEHIEMLLNVLITDGEIEKVCLKCLVFLDFILVLVLVSCVSLTVVFCLFVSVCPLFFVFLCLSKVNP